MRAFFYSLIFFSSLFAGAVEDRLKVADLATEARIASGQMRDYARARAAIMEAYAISPNNPKVQNLFPDLAGPETALATDEEIFFIKDTPEFKVRLTILSNPVSAGTAWIKKASLFIKKGGSVVRTLSWNGATPIVFSWNGKTDAGETAADGSYELGAEITGKLGFTLTSGANRVFLVSKKLEAMIAVKDKLFAAGKEPVRIQTFYPDRTRVTSWELAISGTSGKVVRRINGTAFPETITWDGKDESGEIVPGGDVFTLKLKGKDKSGKEFESNPDQSESEIEIVDLGGGKLSFKMSTFQFDIGKADLKPASYVLLDRVGAILKKYAWYTVAIQGHTDNVGTPADNLALSKKRAESVSTYLSAKDAKVASRVSSEGLGQTKPVADNGTEIGRAKNRRVEFLLTKIPLKE